jgi:glycosyltransferase involved in cell wall biosynthesis
MPDGPTVLFVGRLVEGKRPGDALAAFARVLEEHPDATLVFVGDGPLRTELESEAESLGVSDQVRFLGEVGYDEMPFVYRGGDVLVLPSRAEGFPRTILEAIASNVPVVASDLAQFSNVVEGCGALASTGDVYDFSRKLAMQMEGSDSSDSCGVATGTNEWSDTVNRTTAVLRRIGR